MNRVLGDYFETLLYKIFVSIDEHTNIAEVSEHYNIRTCLSTCLQLCLSVFPCVCLSVAQAVSFCALERNLAVKLCS